MQVFFSFFVSIYKKSEVSKDKKRSCIKQLL